MWNSQFSLCKYLNMDMFSFLKRIWSENVSFSLVYKSVITWFFFVLSNKWFFSVFCSAVARLSKEISSQLAFSSGLPRLSRLSRLFGTCFKYTFHCSTGTWPENTTRIQQFISINQYISYLLLYKNVCKVNGLNQQHMSYNCCALGIQAWFFDYEISPVCNMP